MTKADCERLLRFYVRRWFTHPYRIPFDPKDLDFSDFEVWMQIEGHGHLLEALDAEGHFDLARRVFRREMLLH
ncbi:hypothetical protein [Tranquillimonas rosea]|uniref:hypothetical protein n=1 Tax=Tranquillimonas rosea TaxID=641238 RepID=UPI003BAA04E7